jgi:hypothetical protein
MRTHGLLFLGFALTATIAAAGCGGKASGTGGTGGTTASTSTGTGTGTGTGTTSGTGGSASTSSGTGGSGTTSTSSSSSGTGGMGAGGGVAKFPDTTSSIALLVDQLPDGMTAGQQMFVATHFVGSQKLTLDISGPLRAINPGFIVLHYHLAIWQSDPGGALWPQDPAGPNDPPVTFILNGTTWGNDYPTVAMNESWFWHNTAGMRIASTVDEKILMNLDSSGFAAYWQSSLEQQVAAGQYDGIFFDSASPALLQAEVGGQDARLAGTGARDTAIAEWGGMTYIQGWEAWIAPLNDALAAKGIPLIPNTGPFITGWDNTDYSLTAGIFSEGFGDPSFAESDWMASTNELLSLAAKGKIMILQNYLGDPGDVATRLYYLGNYLLVKGNRTYLDYFASGPLEWYPEWGIDLGAPTNTGMTVDDLLQGGVYQRTFANGTVLVNPSSSPVNVTLGGSMNLVMPSGGGAIDASGTGPGSVTMMPVTSITVAATGAAILLK